MVLVYLLYSGQNCQTSDDNERVLPVRTKSLPINFISSSEPALKTPIKRRDVDDYRTDFVHFISIESPLARLQRRTIDSIDRLDFSLASRLDWLHRQTIDSIGRLDRFRGLAVSPPVQAARIYTHHRHSLLLLSPKADIHLQVRWESLWCTHTEFSYESPGERILKIGPHLPKLLSNIMGNIFKTQRTN